MAQALLAVVVVSAAVTNTGGHISKDYAGGSGSVWFVDPITVKVTHDRRVPFASSSKHIDVAGMRGECERVQIWGWNDDGDLSDVALAFADLEHTASLERDLKHTAVFSKRQWSYKQQGFVNASTPTHYSCVEDILTPGGNNHAETAHACLPGWYPDPLLDVDADKGIPLIETGFTQPIYVEVCIPYGQTAGNYSGKLDVIAASGPLFTIPIALEVWSIDLPMLNDTESFNTAFNFNSNMSSWYPEGTEPETWWTEWFEFLAHFRVPGDRIYLREPRPLDEYKVLAESGAKWMGIGEAVPPPCQQDCAQIRSSYVESWIKKLTPTLTSLDSLGLLNKTYMYGFDGMPEIWNQSVYEIFGDLKKKWPDLTTMAALDWETIPADLPLDIWVDEYTDYGTSASYLVPTSKEKIRQSFLASNPSHQFWWYWCIGPEDPRAMNTFIERPGIEARLLYWLSALHAINGMLYYDVAIWSKQCPEQRDCKAVGRINQTGLTDFEPATFPDPQPGSANGDGSFTYPGEGGKPLGSIRLSNIADGIEDWELFNKLGSNRASISNAADLIGQLVTNQTNRHENPSLLEKLRREAAHRVMASDQLRVAKA